MHAPGLTTRSVQRHLAAIGLLAVLHRQRPDLRPQLSWTADGHAILTVRGTPDGMARSARQSLGDDWLIHRILEMRIGGSRAAAADIAATELVEWLRRDYRPTPMISAWNGGSGLGLGYTAAGGQKASSRTVPELHTVAEHYPGWADQLDHARRLVDLARDDRWDKPTLILHARNWAPHPAWVQACWLWPATDPTGVAPTGPRVNAALGTGGNIGSGDLGALTARRILDILADPHRSRGWLLDVLSGDTTGTPLVASTQAHIPDAAGGLVNPWRWLLAMEGLVAISTLPHTVGAFPARVTITSVVAPTPGVSPHDALHELLLPSWTGPRSWPVIAADLDGGWTRWRGRVATTIGDAMTGIAHTRTGMSPHRWASCPRNGPNPLYVPARSGVI